MDVILYFFRDKITGIHYIMYAFVCFFLMFSLIGYLFKQKYAKVEIKLNTSKPQVEDSKDLEKDKKNKSKIIKNQPEENQVAIQNAMGLVSKHQIGENNQVTQQVINSQPIINQAQQTQQVAVASQTVSMQQPQVVQQPQTNVNNFVQK